MQLVDSKLYVTPRGAKFPSIQFGRAVGAAPQTRGLVAQLKATSASARLLALMLATFGIAAGPALLATVRSTVSLWLQILLQAGHAGLIAFQIFGR